MISAVQLQAPASMASLTRALLCAVASFFGCWVGGHAQCANDVRENYGLSETVSLRNRTLTEQRLEEVRSLAQLQVDHELPSKAPLMFGKPLLNNVLVISPCTAPEMIRLLGILGGLPVFTACQCYGSTSWWLQL